MRQQREWTEKAVTGTWRRKKCDGAEVKKREGKRRVQVLESFRCLWMRWGSESV